MKYISFSDIDPMIYINLLPIQGLEHSLLFALLGAILEHVFQYKIKYFFPSL